MRHRLNILVSTVSGLTLAALLSGCGGEAEPAADSGNAASQSQPGAGGDAKFGPDSMCTKIPGAKVDAILGQKAVPSEMLRGKGCQYTVEASKLRIAVSQGAEDIKPGKEIEKVPELGEKATLNEPLISNATGESNAILHVPNGKGWLLIGIYPPDGEDFKTYKAKAVEIGKVALEATR